MVPGVFVHTNTIEEYEELDLEAIMSKQHSQISNEVRELENGLKVNMANRFVIAIFGDLKNYVYHYKFATLEIDSEHVNQVKANKVAKVFDQAQIDALTAGLQEALLKEDKENVELSSFMVGDCLCALDPSPKLPSAFIINQVCLTKAKKVLLIREKLSRLSTSIKLDSSIAMLLEYGEVAE